MMDVFIDIQAAGEYQKMVVEGEVDDKAAYEAWSALMTEYYGLIGDGNYKSLLLQSGRLEDKKAKIFCVKNTARYLLKLHEEMSCTSPLLLQELKSLGYPVRFSRGNTEQYVKDLNLVFTRIKREEADVEYLERESRELNGKTQRPEMYYGDLISLMASTINVQVDLSRTSVWQFCFHYRRLRLALKPKPKP